MISPSIDLPLNGENKILNTLPYTGASFVLASIVQRSGPVVVVVPDMLSMEQMATELQFFLGKEDKYPVIQFSDWEILPYDQFSPHQDIISNRMSVLYRLPHLTNGVVLVAAGTLLHRLCPKEYVIQHSFLLKVGDTFSLEKQRALLIKSGYRLVSQVMEHGEFSVKGSLFDLFPMGSNAPFRIDLFGDTIDSIRVFDPETQRTAYTVQEIRLLPAREYPLTDEGVNHFRRRWNETLSHASRDAPIYVDVSNGLASPGLEYYLPLFFESTCTLFDYFPKNTTFVQQNEIEFAMEEFWRQVENRFDQYQHDRLRPLLPPKSLFISKKDFHNELKKYPLFTIQSQEEKRILTFPMKTLPDLKAEKNKDPVEKLQQFLKNYTGRVLFTAETTGRREILREMLGRIHLHPMLFDSWDAFIGASDQYGILIAPLVSGIELSDLAIAVISEFDLMGQRVQQRRRRGKKFERSDDQVIQSLSEIEVGSLIVHIDYGIGRYLGLQNLTLSEEQGEFMVLEYAGGDKLYVPVTSLHMISRYRAPEGEHAPLNRLGSDHWQKAKKKALEEVRDVAAELLNIYASRSEKMGFAFKKPEEQYRAFSDEFAFEETPDQELAITKVLEDLTSEKPMDRVVCGDVGFGKTEVAMRAAFIAVQSNKQVAILVPTTLLAQQHYQTFCDRFSNFPVTIDMISRFRSAKEQAEILKRLQAGKIDIIIGTHKLLNSDVTFKNLGLLIIDEEHRFGVQQKEKLKSLRVDVDILTLTATPIPRTLNMALSGLRDLSIIATPPLKRLSIKTFVREYNSALIQEAIMRELNRGGQIYFLHNEVETIEKVARELEKWVPLARIQVAHGQMRERELEQIMSDFYHRRFNVLVCTTIIETGIDIPTANTIIINRADKLGLAQLHQLRGRVGRSHHQAYAFLLTPPPSLLTPDAMKRLDAIVHMEELGAGFTLATQDLEIRGAGELLGEDQSGNMHSIGFHLYMELLEEAVDALKAGKEPLLDMPIKSALEVNLKVPTLIPEQYLPDVHIRLILYKRIANAKDNEALQELQAEMIDRFGPLPTQTQNLFHLTRLKLRAQPLHIKKIEAGPKGGWLDLGHHPNINVQKMVDWVQQKPQQYKIEGKNKLRFMVDLSDLEKRFDWIENLLQDLQV